MVGLAGISKAQHSSVLTPGDCPTPEATPVKKKPFDFSLQYQAVEWNAAAGLLNAVYLTLWKHPYIVNVPNLKNLIGTCQCLVVGEDSLTSLTDHHGPSGRRPELPPQGFCSIVFKLVALQVWSIF